MRMITIKQYICGQWQEKEIAYADLNRYAGTDTVAVMAEGMIWCGNQKWYDRYAEDSRFHIVTKTTELDALLEQAKAIFLENREHRAAYMTQDGDVTEQEANKHMDTLPLVYGQSEFEFPEDF